MTEKGKNEKARAGVGDSPIRVLFSLLFILIVFVPLGTHILGIVDLEENQKREGRSYEPFPPLAGDYKTLSAFPKAFEVYFKDRFGLRIELVNLNSAVAFRVFKVSPNTSILIGRDGWFFWGTGPRRVQKGAEEIEKPTNAVADHMGVAPFSNDELRAWQRSLEERQLYLGEMGIPYVFAVGPAKRMIYGEYLPPLVQTLKGETRAEQFNEYFKKNSELNLVDLLEHLRAEKPKRESPYLFYKTDGHWNHYGAFLAYQAMMNRVDGILKEQEVSPMTFDSFDLKWRKNWSHRRFCARMGTNIYEPFPILVPRPGNPIANIPLPTNARMRKKMEQYIREGLVEKTGKPRTLGDVGLGLVGIRKRKLVNERGEEQAYNIVHNPTGDPLHHIYMFGDSFLEKTIFMFAAHANTTTFLREILDFNPHIFHYKNKPDLVIQEMNQEYLFKQAPKNPDEVVLAYLRVKHQRSGKILMEKRGTLGSVLGKDKTLPVTIGSDNDSDEVAARIDIDSNRRIVLRLLHKKNGSKPHWLSTHVFDAKHKTHYLELPSVAPGDELFIRAPKLDANTSQTQVDIVVKGIR